MPDQPGDTTSLRFHRSLGFTVVPGDDVVDGVPVHRDHDGPGLHRVLFTRPIDDEGAAWPASAAQRVQ